MSSSAQPPQKTSFFDFLKPRYHEAVFRLRNSVIAVIALTTLTHLLPIPTPYASAWNFYRDTFQSSWEKGVAIAGANLPSVPRPRNTLLTRTALSFSELVVFGLLLANILQATIAIRDPPTPYPPLPSLTKALSPPRQQPSAKANRRSLGGNKSAGLSPKVRNPPTLPFFSNPRSQRNTDDPAAPAALLRVHLWQRHERHRRRQRVGPTRSCAVLLARIHQLPRVAVVAFALFVFCPT
jgi:hypothetical protein